MQKLIVSVAVLLVVPLFGSAAHARPNRVVLGYSATWRDGDSPPQCYNYDSLTYLARAFLIPHPDGSIEVPDGFFNHSMESLARTHGVKLLISIGGEASNADNWLSIARHPQYFRNFCDRLNKLLAAHGYDGIDIDWEPSATTTEDGLAYTSFLSNLRKRFPNRIITTALGASEYWIGHFVWKDVVDNVDYVNVMTYDYSGGWGGRADFCSNLFPASVYQPKPTLSDAEGMMNLIENHKVPPQKLLMGVTFWPSQFAVDHIGDPFPVNGPDYTMNITYSDTLCLLRTEKYAEFWDDKAAAPYLERKAGGSVVVYENSKSIQRKCEYAAKLGCAGVMIWHVGADVDGNKAPLMDAIADSCGVAKQIFPREILERQISERQSQIKQLKSRLVHPEEAADEQSRSELSSYSEDQLKLLCDRVEKNWGMLQDQLWQKTATQHPTK